MMSIQACEKSAAGYVQVVKRLSDEIKLENLQLWTAERRRPNVDLIIKGGVLKEIRDRQEPAPSTRILLPSGVDVQVHLRVPGQEHKELPETGLKAAVHGGFAAILTMPNTDPVIDRPEYVLEAKRRIESASRDFGVQVDLSAAATMGQAGKQLVDFSALLEVGVKAFTDDGKGVESDELMAKIFAQLEPTERAFLQHAEMPGHGGCLAPGPVQEAQNIPSYPASAEIEMVRRDLKLLERFPKARYHVLHISSGETAELLANARKKGLRATGEVSPHHLYFSSDDIQSSNLAFKMNPPLRSSEDRSMLLKALVNGDIDFVATDHAPHSSTDKSDNFIDSAYGTLGLETCLPVLMELYRRGQISSERLVDVFSKKPAEFLGLDASFGNIGEGLAFRAVLVDLDLPLTKQSETEIQSLSKNSCFADENIMGQICARFSPGASFDLLAH